MPEGQGEQAGAELALRCRSRANVLVRSCSHVLPHPGQKWSGENLSRVLWRLCLPAVPFGLSGSTVVPPASGFFLSSFVLAQVAPCVAGGETEAPSREGTLRPAE